MAATKLTGTIYLIDTNLMFLEFFDPTTNTFEYYIKDNHNDFEYQFGVSEPFSPIQLQQLYDQGYFS